MTIMDCIRGGYTGAIKKCCCVKSEHPKSFRLAWCAAYAASIPINFALGPVEVVCLACACCQLCPVVDPPKEVAQGEWDRFTDDGPMNVEEAPDVDYLGTIRRCCKCYVPCSKKHRSDTCNMAFEELMGWLTFETWNILCGLRTRYKAAKLDVCCFHT